MPNPTLFYLSLSSVAAVLLGICVTLRNNAFATMLRHADEEIRLAGQDYELILERSAFGAMGAGMFFAVTIASAFVGLFYGASESLDGWAFIFAMLSFSLGLIVLLYALFSGHLERPSWPFQSPSKVDRSERPDVEIDQ